MFFPAQTICFYFRSDSFEVIKYYLHPNVRVHMYVKLQVKTTYYAAFIAFQIDTILALINLLWL